MSFEDGAADSNFVQRTEPVALRWRARDRLEIAALHTRDRQHYPDKCGRRYALCRFRPALRPATENQSATPRVRNPP